MKKYRYLIPLAVFGLALTGCSNVKELALNYTDDDLEIDTEWEDYSIPPTGVKFADNESLISIERGETYSYNYSVTPKGATGYTLNWESSNDSVATVEDGTVTAVSGGHATITVGEAHQLFEPVSVEVDVTVMIKDFEVTAPTTELDWSHDYNFDVTYDPVNTTYRTLVWSIPEEEQHIATVSNGVVTTYRETGTVHLSVRNAQLPEVEKTFVLNVADREIHVQSIALSTTANRVEIGHTAQLSAVIDPVNADDAPDLAFYSRNPEIASVDPVTGEITGVAAGTTKVFAHCDDKDSNEIEIEVFEVYATALSIDKSSDYIVTNDEDGQKQLVTNVTTSEPGSMPTYAVVKYSSDEPSIVSIDSTGLMTAHKSGSATITATIKGQGDNVFSDSVTVTSKAYVTNVLIFGLTAAYVGEEVELVASVEPAPVEDDVISWTVNPEEKVSKTVDGNTIKITGLETGPVTVTATSEHNHISTSHTVSFSIKPADYTLAGDFNNWTAADQRYQLVKVSAEGEEPHYQIEDVTLAKGQGVKVVDATKTKWYANSSTYDGCGYTLVDDGYGGFNMKLNHSGVYNIDFYPESPYANTITFDLITPIDDPVIESGYYLEGSITGWKLDENLRFLGDPDNDNHFYIADVALVEGDEIKAYDSVNDSWLGVTVGATGTYWTGVDDENLRVDEDGTYYVNLYIESEYGNHLDLYKEIPTPTVTPYTAEITIDTTYFDGWTPAVSDLSLYMWTTNNEQPLGTWAQVKGNLNDGSVTITNYDKEITNFIVYYTRGGNTVQTVDLKCSVCESATYVIDFTHSSTSGGKIIGVTLAKVGDTPTPPAPTYTYDYYVQGIGGSWTNKEEYKLIQDTADANHMYLNHIELEVADQIRVYLDTEDPNVTEHNIGVATDGNHYTVGQNGKLVVSDSGTYTIDFYKHADNGNHISLYDESTPTYTYDYYVEGIEGWSIDAKYLMVATENPNHFILEDVELTEGMEIKVYCDTEDPALEGNHWFGVLSTYDDTYGQGTADGNLRVKADGTYTINLYVTSEYGNHITLTPKSQPQPPQPTTVKTFYFTNSKHWDGKIYAYVWKGDSILAAWPGTEMTFVETNSYSQNVYSITFDTALYDKIIFSNNSIQTSDIDLTDFGTNNACYINDQGSIVFYTR